LLLYLRVRRKGTVFFRSYFFVITFIAKSNQTWYSTQKTEEDEAMQLTLWVIEVSNATMGELLPVYATSEEEAWKKAHPWLAEHPQYPHRTIRAFPEGFLAGQRTWLPGVIDD
jgi:hypothetical protein